jgi:hypothetical protein
MNDALIPVAKTNLKTLKQALAAASDAEIGAYVAPLKAMESELKEMLADVTKRLKAHALSGATETHNIRVGDTVASLQPTGKKWDDEHTLALLRARKKDPARYMEVEYKATDEGIKTLRDEGVFTEADVESCKLKRGWALKDVRIEKEVK